jgi:hypothetical protein
MLIICVLLSLFHVIRLSVVVIRQCPLSLANYFHVNTVSIITLDRHHDTTLCALSFEVTFLIIRRGVLIYGFNCWVLIVDVRAGFVHILIEIGAEEGG